MIRQSDPTSRRSDGETTGNIDGYLAMAARTRKFIIQVNKKIVHACLRLSGPWAYFYSGNRFGTRAEPAGGYVIGNVCLTIMH
jgi:hypothetical protein